MIFLLYEPTTQSQVNDISKNFQFKIKHTHTWSDVWCDTPRNKVHITYVFVT